MVANLCVFLCVDKKRAKQIGCHFADCSQLAHTLMESRRIWKTWHNAPFSISLK